LERHDTRLATIDALATGEASAHEPDGSCLPMPACCSPSLGLSSQSQLCECRPPQTGVLSPDRPPLLNYEVHPPNCCHCTLVEPRQRKGNPPISWLRSRFPGCRCRRHEDGFMTVGGRRRDLARSVQGARQSGKARQVDFVVKIVAQTSATRPRAVM
jgi:hypothetical protein